MDTALRKKCEWQKSTRKDTQHHSLLRKSQVNRNERALSTAIECLSFHRLTKTGADTEQVELSYIAGGNAKRYCHLRKTVGWFLRNLNVHLPYQPAIPFLPIYSREMKMTQSLVGKRLFVTSKIWKKICPH